MPLMNLNYHLKVVHTSQLKSVLMASYSTAMKDHGGIQVAFGD